MAYFVKNNMIYLLFISIIYPQIKLDINTIPEEVDVYLDDVNLGQSPIRNERIIPGQHIFEIKKKFHHHLHIHLNTSSKPTFYLQPLYFLFHNANHCKHDP